MLYELATLSCPLLAVGQVSAGVEAWLDDPDAKGSWSAAGAARSARWGA